MLRLVVISASNLINVDFGPSNKSDPYVKAIFRGEERKTDHIKDDLDPVWTENNIFEWDLCNQALSSSDEIIVKVRDWERILKKKLLGKVTVLLKDILKTKDYTIEQSYPLVDSHNRATLSTILLKIEYKPSQRALEATQLAELQYMNEDSNEEDIAGEESESEGKAKRKRRRAHGKPGRREWSTKVRHYKIRVKIHDGRHLPGTNISPITRITVHNEKRETRVKRSTNSPAFNQTFTFNFHTSEAELFDELLVIEVFNSRRILSNALLGYFESDIGAIYEFPGHAFTRKWILLTGVGQEEDDEENQSKRSRMRGKDGGTAGYLKVTAMVLGPDDEPPLATSATHDNEGEDDVDGNCLMPTGISRQPAEFLLRVYLAEDLPQMDTGWARNFRRWFLPGGGKEDSGETKKMVDPYMVFSFCGKKVQTSRKYRQNNPTYNELLTLPLMFPSMCEKIKFQFYDWDRGTTDDVIATSFLSLSDITGQAYASGFLPQFGPCFVNFYGSPREFSMTQSDDHKAMNEGMGEGTAYRGRMLIELTTGQGSSDSRQSVHKIHDEDVFRIQPFLKQDKYKVFACFKDAAMISKTEGAIEFEVSIGNFGNALDETVAACNTPPTNPVYDGSHYHYLPWRHYKPCICLDCSWENIAFRIEPLNIINRLCEKLESLIERVKADIAKIQDGDEKRGVQMLASCLETIITQCSHTDFLDLPGTKNSLDFKLLKLRRKELESLVEDARQEKAKILQKVILEGTQLVHLEETMEVLREFLQRLKGLAFEPQISTPDVIIWMLYGGRRVAFHRVPIQDVLFSKNKEARGKYCGKTMELIMKYHEKKAQDDKEYPEVPAMVRVELWVGLRDFQHEWSRRVGQEGQFAVFAEAYQNEVKPPLLNWGKPGIGLRPHYSNASGDLELDLNKFVAPKDWKFNGNWEPLLESSLMYDYDWGLATYTDETYEHQGRSLLGGGWNTESHWTEADGEPSTGPRDSPPPEGWKWTSKSWTVDMDRAVDADGWEFSVSETFGGIYVKSGKAMHMTRRRRWVCTRVLVDSKAARKQEKLQKLVAEGWEYAPSFSSKFHVKPRGRDIVRRKRLLKELFCERDPELKKVELPPKLAINLKIKKQKSKKFKAKEKKRKESTVKDPLLEEDSHEEREGHMTVLPRMFIVYEKPHKFQLWVYIYQARNLLSMDESGMSDPYVRVAFGNQSQKTEWKSQTICPTWDQTLIFSQVEIFDTLETALQNPPNVVMEVFDKDPIGKHDFIGRCTMKPKVQTKGARSRPPELAWVTIYKGQTNAGDVLTTSELFLDEGETLPNQPTPKDLDSKELHLILPVRDVIRPAMQTMVVEVLCWGVRNMKKYNYNSVTSPSVEFEWGNQIFKSEILDSSKKSLNFVRPNLSRKIVKLPVEPYTPAMNIRVYDHRIFSQKPLVGVHSIASLKSFKSDEPPLVRSRANTESVSSLPSPSPIPRPPPTQNAAIDKTAEVKFDWWSKYFYSVRENNNKTRVVKQDGGLSGQLMSFFSSGDDNSRNHLDLYGERGYPTLEILPMELEKMEKFERLEDFVSIFELKRGKSKAEDEDENDDVGELKASFRVYPVDEEIKEEELPVAVFANLPEMKLKWPIKCIVRVYVICAFDLQPQDTNGMADPYLVVSLGNTTYDETKNCQKNILDPVFGKMFEFNVSIPTAKDLKVKVMDNDRGLRNDVIGETVIDLEQRLLSRLHASCGLSKTYSLSGPFAWRDSKRPKDILRDFCHAKGYEKPYFYPSVSPNTLVIKTKNDSTSLSLKLDDIENLDEENRQRTADQQLSLLALYRLDLVPEHVETRTLYSSLQPHIPQGRLQMWVDLFPLNARTDIKEAVDIEQRKPISYVLRVVIWDTTEVHLQETSLSGEKMSDIYVKGWIEGINEKQKTDVHFRSLDGDGNFNWRMAFPFKHLQIENKILVSKKTNFLDFDKTTEKVEPQLKFQIWENDKFSPDDFLGIRTLDLHHLARPCKSPRYCGSKHFDPSVHNPSEPNDFVDLFHCKNIRGWWGCWKGDSLTGKLQGKVDMSLEILTEEESKLKPAGLGRNEPNQHPNLPEPNRPKTSFLWFMSPFKTMRYVIWRNYKWYIIGVVVLALLFVLILLFVYNTPGYTVKKILGA